MTSSMTSQLTQLAVVLMMVFITGVLGESCPMYNNGFYAGYKYCGNGCCGRYPNYYCCDFSTAVMAGIVLGSIVVICIVICVCVYCAKKKSHSGRVIRPVRPANTIVFTGASGSYPAAGPAQVPVPPPYKLYDTPPPYTANYPYGQQPAAHYGQPMPQQYPYGTAPMAAPIPSAAPPQYASAAQSSAAPQYSYGQGQGWSNQASSSPPAAFSSNAPGPQSVPPPASTGQGPRRAESVLNRNAPSSSSESASPFASGPEGFAAPTSTGLAQGPRRPESVLNRNTVTTRNLNSRLPPLPPLPNK